MNMLKKDNTEKEADEQFKFVVNHVNYHVVPSVKQKLYQFEWPLYLSNY